MYRALKKNPWQRCTNASANNWLFCSNEGQKVFFQMKKPAVRKELPALLSHVSGTLNNIG
jgi:hypothetical protein